MKKLTIFFSFVGIIALLLFSSALSLTSSEQDAVITGGLDSPSGSTYVIGPLGFYWNHIDYFCQELGVTCDYDGISQVIEKYWLPINLRFITIWVPNWGSGIARANTSSTYIPFDQNLDNLLSACDKYGISVMFFWSHQWAVGDTQWDTDVYNQFPDLITNDMNGTPLIPPTPGGINAFKIDDPRYEKQLKEDLKQLYEHYGHHKSWVGVGQFTGDYSHYAGIKGSPGCKNVGFSNYTIKNFVDSIYYLRGVNASGYHLYDNNGDLLPESQRTKCKLWEMFIENNALVLLKSGVWQQTITSLNDLENYGGTVYSGRESGGHVLAVKFLAPENLDGFRIKWYGYKLGDPNDLRIELYKNKGPYDWGDEPKNLGNPIETEIQGSSVMTSVAEWQPAVSFSSRLAKGDYYWLVFSSDGGSISDKYVIYRKAFTTDESRVYASTDGYDGGWGEPYAWRKRNSAILWVQDSNGQDKKIYPKEDIDTGKNTCGTLTQTFNAPEDITFNSIFLMIPDRPYSKVNTTVHIKDSSGTIIASGELNQELRKGTYWWTPLLLNKKLNISSGKQYTIEILATSCDFNAYQIRYKTIDPPQAGFQGQSNFMMFFLTNMEISDLQNLDHIDCVLGSPSNDPVFDKNKVAIRFKPMSPSQLSTFDIKLGKFGNPDNLRISLMNDDGTGSNPGSSELEFQEISPASIPTNGWLTTNGWSYSLNSDNYYWILLSSPSSTSGNGYPLWFKTTNYLFKMMYSQDNGNTWTPYFPITASPAELVFKITTTQETFRSEPEEVKKDFDLTDTKLVAQSFSPSSDKMVKGAIVLMSKENYGYSELIAEVRADDDDAPSSQVIGTAKTSPNDYSAKGFVYFDFQIPVHLVAGQKYWLVLKVMSTTVRPNFGVGFIASRYREPEYSFGRMDYKAKYSTDGGASWYQPNNEERDLVFALLEAPPPVKVYSTTELSNDICTYHAHSHSDEPLWGWNAYLNLQVDGMSKGLMEWLEGYSGRRMMTIGPNSYTMIREADGEKYGYFGYFITGPLPCRTTDQCLNTDYGIPYGSCPSGQYCAPSYKVIRDKAVQYERDLLKHGNLGFMPGGSIGHPYDNTGAIMPEQIAYYYRLVNTNLARGISIYDMFPTGTFGITNETQQYWTRIYGNILSRMRYYGGYFGHEKGTVNALFIGDRELGIIPTSLASSINITLYGTSGNNQDFNLTRFDDFKNFDVIVWIASGPRMDQITTNAQERIKQFVQGGGGFVVVNGFGWEDWANDILGVDYVPGLGSGTKQVSDPNHPILKPYGTSILPDYDYYRRGSNSTIILSPSSVHTIVTDTNSGPFLFTNEYGSGRAVFVGRPHATLGDIGTYPYSRLGAPRNSVLVLINNAIFYASNKENLLPVWWYSSYKAEQAWNNETYYSISGKPGNVLVWLSNNREISSFFEIHLNASFYGIDPNGWIIWDAASGQVLTNGIGDDITVSINLPAKSFKPLYIFNASDVYSNVFITSQTRTTDQDRFWLKGPYMQNKWLIVKSNSPPTNVTANGTEMPKRGSLNDLLSNIGYYYDSVEGIVYVNYNESLPTLPIPTTTTTTSSSTTSTTGVSTTSTTTVTTTSSTTTTATLPLDTLFTSGFEDGWTGWDDTWKDRGYITIVNKSSCIEGNYCLESNSTDYWAHLAPAKHLEPAEQIVYVRGYFRFMNLTNPRDFIKFIRIGNRTLGIGKNQSLQVRPYYQTDGMIKWGVSWKDDSSDMMQYVGELGSEVLNGVWYCVEAMVKRSIDDAELHLWVDNEEIWNKTAFSNEATTGEITRIHVGLTENPENTTGYPGYKNAWMYTDDVVIARSRIGC